MREINTDAGVIQTKPYLGNPPLLLKRKRDQRYLSFEQLLRAAKNSFECSNQCRAMKGGDLHFHGTQKRLSMEIPGKVFDYRDGQGYGLTSWSMRQICLILGVPFKLINTFSAVGASNVLNERCKFVFHPDRYMPDRHQYVVPTISEMTTPGGRTYKRVRSFTTPLFNRIMDYELLRRISEVDGIRFARMFRGEMDMHVWAYSVHDAIDVDGHQFYPGVHIRNSEVGARLIEMTKTLVSVQWKHPMYFGTGKPRRHVLRGYCTYSKITGFLNRCVIALEFMKECLDWDDEVEAIRAAKGTLITDVEKHIKNWDTTNRSPGGSSRLPFDEIIERTGERASLLDISNALNSVFSVKTNRFEDLFAMAQRCIGADINRARGQDVLFVRGGRSRGDGDPGD